MVFWVLIYEGSYWVTGWTFSCQTVLAGACIIRHPQQWCVPAPAVPHAPIPGVTSLFGVSGVTLLRLFPAS